MSSDDTAISVRGLGKAYTLRHNAPRHTTLAEAVRSRLRRPFRRSSSETFWALKDVSFDVKRGEVVGVIGRNGAGKSTLLKVLSRITEPTTGEVDLYGRVGSLLEVGTGFRQELTGRENIYLNGAILGMRRKEITRQFDAIVDFAEVEKFLDTPVKRYSSGMYVRLAFAVAAHLRTEILIVDEVLAVGDAEFQRRCLGKMGEVAKGGRTILFVSHNMSAVQALCSRAVVMDKGQIAFTSGAGEAVAFYLTRHAPGRSFTRERLPSSGIAIESAEVSVCEAESGTTLELTVAIRSDRAATATVDLRIQDRAGVACAFGSLGSLDPTTQVQLKAGTNRLKGGFDIAMLAVGKYLIGLDVTQPDVCYFDRVETCLAFEIHSPPRPPAIRRLHQVWGHGSSELRSALIGLTTTPCRGATPHD